MDDVDIKNALTTYGFTQVVKKPTRTTKESSTLIDIIATNNVKNIKYVAVIPLSLSDHDMVICVRKQNNLKYKPQYKTCRDYSKYDHMKLVSELVSIDWEPVMKCVDVNNALNLFKNILTEAFDKHVPLKRKRVKGQPCPWIDEDVCPHMDQRDKLLRKARKSNSTTDWNLYRQMRNTCTNMLQTAKWYHHNLLNENRLNPKIFWKAIKEIFPLKRKTTPPSTPSISPTERASKFASYFSKVILSLKKSSFKLKNLVWKTPSILRQRTNLPFRFTYVSVVFVRKQLKALKRKKATGLDLLPSALLKDSADEISKPVAHIINLSLNSASVPTTWKRAKVIPVFKSGSADDVSNFRPISILPILSKIMERAVFSQLIEHLETNKLLTNCQFGY